jgi:hypothetical protein
LSEPSSASWKWRCWIGSAQSVSFLSSRVAGCPVQLGDDRPVADLAGLGHREELEAVGRDEPRGAALWSSGD